MQFVVRRVAQVERVVATAVEAEHFLVERPVVQAGHAEGEMADGQVQAAVQHPLLQLGGRADVDVEVHVVPPRDEALGGGRQGRVRVGDGGVDDAEVEGAADVLLEHVGIHAEGFHRRQQALGRLVDGHALLGEAEAAAPALAELDPEARLQLGHLFADGGLADIEGGLCRGEAATANYGLENPQQFQVDVIELDHRNLSPFYRSDFSDFCI
ncbi:hypothetical protein D9M68_605850 [compost metagenome]